MSISPKAERPTRRRRTRDSLSTNSPSKKKLRPASTLEIIIYSTDRPGSFRATHGTSTLVKKSRQPICDAARELHRRGYPDETLLVSKWNGSDHESMRGTLGEWRASRIREDRGGPRRTKYEPFPTTRVGETVAKAVQRAGPSSGSDPSRSERHRARSRR
jgi:hypothetical protein